jgi:phospholipase C
VNNGGPPDPYDWDVPTIFNVLKSLGKSWPVYNDTILTPSQVLEASFLVDPNDEHPPHDVTAGEQFLYAIWTAVRI